MKKFLKPYSLNFKSETGQALITLLFFTVIAVTVITATVTILFINNLSASTSEQGTMAYYIAESGAEDGYLRILRNPNYTVANQVLTVGSGTVSLSVNSTRLITSIGTYGNTKRTINIQIDNTVYTNTGKISVLTRTEQ